MTIVIDDGLQGLTLGKVAKSLDVAVGGLYRYFPSKEALVAGLQQRAVANFGARLKPHLDAHPPRNSATAHLAYALAPFWLYFDGATAHPDDHRLMDVMLSALAPTLDEDHALAVEEVLGPTLALAQQGLAEAAHAGAIDAGDDRQRALILWGATHGLGHLRNRDRIEAASHHAHALCHAMFVSLLRGFGAHPRSAAACVQRLTR